MKKKPPSTDGFTIPRRQSSTPDRRRVGIDSIQTHQSPTTQQKQKETYQVPRSQPKKSSTIGVELTQADIEDSLRDIDNTPEKSAKRRRFLPTRRQVKWFFIILAILILLGVGYLAVRAFLAGNKVFDGNIFDLFGSGQPLKQDELGRSNIIIFGTTEDSQSHIDDGGGEWLTDSIMLLSIDQERKVAMMTSVPRDLWVEYGKMCINGYEGKINAAYQCGADFDEDPKAGAALLQQMVGKVYGLDVHYYVHINTAAVEQAVNAVGGVDIVIESDDPRGIYDPNFDWECNYECNFVKYPNGPAHLDGKHALLLARARDSTGMGYGLSGGNFAREQYQQKIMIALRNKAASAGTLANPVAVSQLIDSLGNNVRTNFNTGEIRTLIDLAGEINDERITRVSLEDEENPLVTTGTMSGQSIVRPILGVYDFSAIHAYIRQILKSSDETAEQATIAVLNGSGTVGAAQTTADELTAEGFTVSEVDNAPEGIYPAVVIYQLNAEKTATREQLEQHFGVSVQSIVPDGIVSDADFVIVIGG